MLETLPEIMVGRYLAELDQELRVQGVIGARKEEILGETYSHLVEAIEFSGPLDDREIAEKILQFGSASRLAKRLAREYHRASVAKPFIWPAAFAGSALAGLMAASWLVQVILHRSSNETCQVISYLAVVILFGLGYLARRPSLGQFVVLAVGFTVMMSGWDSVTAVPMAQFYHGKVIGYQSISRGGIREEHRFLNDQIATEFATAASLSEGLRVFSPGHSGETVPSEFMYEGKYWTPEGIQELKYHVPPDQLSRDLLMDTREEAIGKWQAVRAERWREVDRLLSQVPNAVSQLKKSSEYLDWIQTQPLSYRVPINILREGERIGFVLAIGCFVTNLGYGVWLIVGLFGRVRRRLAFGNEPQRLIR